MRGPASRRSLRDRGPEVGTSAQVPRGCGSLTVQSASPGRVAGTLPPTSHCCSPVLREALAAAPPVVHLCADGWEGGHRVLTLSCLPVSCRRSVGIRLPQAVAGRGEGQGCRGPEALGPPGPGLPVLCCPAWGLRLHTVWPCWLQVAPARQVLGWAARPGACELSLCWELCGPALPVRGAPP